MAAVLNSNVASLWASKNLQGAQTKMAESVERLSSGLRINRASDDAAGLGIANALTIQINSANQGIRNLNDGISIVQTAEGAIAAAVDMAQRISILATQGSNLVSATRADLLEKRIRSFLDSHSYNEALSLIAVNPGSGETLSSALSRFLRLDLDEEKQILDFRMEIKIYGDDLPFSKPVHDLQELQETMRSVYPNGPVNHLMPPFGIAVRDRDQLEIDEDGAHIAIAQDLSIGELVSFDPEMHRVPGLGGLLTGTHTVKIESGSETKWVTLPSLAPFQDSILRSSSLHPWPTYLPWSSDYLDALCRDLSHALGFAFARSW